MDTTLQKTLGSNEYSRKGLPRDLPPAHVTIAQWFHTLSVDPILKPRLCSVFGKELTYMFYGAARYRPSFDRSEDATGLPVAFVLHPRVLKAVNRSYPFDTGALKAKHYGEKWTKELTPFKRRFEVRESSLRNGPARLVSALYGDNSRYLVGESRTPKTKEAGTIRVLLDFLGDDLSSLGVDDRQRTIECHMEHEVDLTDNLLWIGFPQELWGTFANLCDSIGYVPQFKTYQPPRNYSASECVAILDCMAREEAIERHARTQ